MEPDHLAHELQQRHFQVWVHNFLKQPAEQYAIRVVEMHCPNEENKKLLAARWKNGSSHFSVRVRYDADFEMIVRFSALGQSIWRVERLENEVATLLYLKKHTHIPVPRVFGTGSCTRLYSPYMVEEFFDGDTIANVCRDRSPEFEKKPAVLWSGISDRDLRSTYRRMAKIILELSKCEFRRIGSLVSQKPSESNGNEEAIFTVAKRPMTYNMNKLALWGNLPPRLFPSIDATFETSKAYFEHLTTQHLDHLRYQRNDAVEDEADCRRKFVARCLLRQIVTEKLIFENDHGPFPLWCDDFRPGNVMLDLKTLQVAAVIDWEYAYAAPVQFTRAAPWWLLLHNPEAWEGDLRQYMEACYMPRFGTWLESIREVEAEMISEGLLTENRQLSGHMEESLTNGWFWICLAMRYNSMLDDIYWNFLDEMFFGAFTSLEERVALLSPEEKEELHGLYEMKVEQAKGKELEDNYNSDVLFWM